MRNELVVARFLCQKTFLEQLSVFDVSELIQSLWNRFCWSWAVPNPGLRVPGTVRGLGCLFLLLIQAESSYYLGERPCLARSCCHQPQIWAGIPNPWSWRSCGRKGAAWNEWLEPEKWLIPDLIVEPGHSSPGRGQGAARSHQPWGQEGPLGAWSSGIQVGHPGQEGTLGEGADPEADSHGTGMPLPPAALGSPLEIRAPNEHFGTKCSTNPWTDSQSWGSRSQITGKALSPRLGIPLETFFPSSSRSFREVGEQREQKLEQGAWKMDVRGCQRGQLSLDLAGPGLMDVAGGAWGHFPQLDFSTP
ncbi:uncharacterized protein LOC113959948 [Corapipo altera]|uniref:uncharacterized protein LOC113959948 n=1 Tax=Corapipo altera TaxID=415028 RepID=UPI000FD6B745|nr:uncharacterized protein LOC113959948 [Corapipo altera]